MEPTTNQGQNSENKKVDIQEVIINSPVVSLFLLGSSVQIPTDVLKGILEEYVNRNGAMTWVAPLKRILDKQVWWEIEEELGEVTDFNIIRGNGNVEIHYKSNGTPKIIYCSDKSLKVLIQAFIYCAEEFSLIRRYKCSSLNHQQTL